MSGFITDSQADAIVETLFDWLVDSATVHDKSMGRSQVAAIVCDATHLDITVQPLHYAYARAKEKRAK